MHSNTVCEKFILVKGDFLGVEKKIVTFSYDRWRSTDISTRYLYKQNSFEGSTCL